MRNIHGLYCEITAVFSGTYAVIRLQRRDVPSLPFQEEKLRYRALIAGFPASLRSGRNSVKEGNYSTGIQLP
ncbi:MAG: hypothetical protein LBH72_05885 [Proteiniphilum sp.]|nr:hypothetical protein [Proteiniphilum sp.]